MGLTGSDTETAEIMRKRRAAQAARPNDGQESAQFVPFTPATTALEALDNAVAGFTPDGDPRILPAPPGQANELLSRAVSGESGVAVRLAPVLTTDVVVPVVIGSLEDATMELDACHCMPANRLDFDLTPDGLKPQPIGRFRNAVDPYAIVFLMLGTGWLKTAAQISYGKPTVDIGLALPLAKAKRANEDLAKARAILDPYVPKPNAPATDVEIALVAAATLISKAGAMLSTATLEFDVRMHEPARLKGGAFTVSADTWGLDATLNGTQVACSMTLEQAFALWQSEKAKTAGTPLAGAGGFSETSSPGGSGGGLKG